jgi:hypothetical protein
MIIKAIKFIIQMRMERQSQREIEWVIFKQVAVITD